MAEFGMHKAKTHLSELVERALSGEEVVITRRGVPAVKLVPEARPGGITALIGAWEGRVNMPDDFTETSQEIADDFGIG